MGNSIQKFKKLFYKQWNGDKIFSIPDKNNIFLNSLYWPPCWLEKEKLHFVTSNFYLQLKHVVSLIKFNAECGSLHYRASLCTVTMTMAITVKRLPFLNFYRFNFTVSVAERTRVVWIDTFKTPPFFFTTIIVFYRTYVILSHCWVQEIVGLKLEQKLDQK